MENFKSVVLIKYKLSKLYLISTGRHPPSHNHIPSCLQQLLLRGLKRAKFVILVNPCTGL